MKQHPIVERNTEGMDLTAQSRFMAKMTAQVIRERGLHKDLSNMACVKIDRVMKVYYFKSK